MFDDDSPAGDGVHYLVGYLPDDRGADALALARMLGGPPRPAELVVCTVVPQTGAAEGGQGGPGYSELVAARVAKAQRRARKRLGDVSAEFVVRLASSPAAGLIDLAEEIGASLLVLGSARSGLMGRYVVGSAAGALQHASPVPLAFAPEGFAWTDTDRLTRVTCGYNDSVDSPVALQTATRLCRAYGVPLRLMTFVFPELPALRNKDADTGARREAAERAAERLGAVAEGVPDGIDVATQVASGGNVAQAMAQPGWDSGDLLVLGSARLGPVSRVFLGSTSLKLLRTCPAPVVAVPRGAGLPTPGSGEKEQG